jgi:hypothetical protein
VEESAGKERKQHVVVGQLELFTHGQEEGDAQIGKEPGAQDRHQDQGDPAPPAALAAALAQQGPADAKRRHQEDELVIEGSGEQVGADPGRREQAEGHGDPPGRDPGHPSDEKGPQVPGHALPPGARGPRHEERQLHRQPVGPGETGNAAGGGQPGEQAMAEQGSGGAGCIPQDQADPGQDQGKSGHRPQEGPAEVARRRSLSGPRPWLKDLGADDAEQGKDLGGHRQEGQAGGGGGGSPPLPCHGVGQKTEQQEDDQIVVSPLQHQLEGQRQVGQGQQEARPKGRWDQGEEEVGDEQGRRQAQAQPQPRLALERPRTLNVPVQGA